MHTSLEFAGSVPAGVVVVDECGCVLWQNTLASLILNGDSPIGIQNGLLSAQEHTAELLRLIKAADGNGSGPCVMSIARSNHPFPLSILVSPILWHASGGNGERQAVAVMISDPALPRTASRTVLQRLYGFTEAEAEVAAHLVNAEPLATVAARLNISSNTVRTHLKKLFQKTGTSRQSELVRLLLSGPALMWSHTTEPPPKRRAADDAED